ncbi:protein fem-1 homolog B-like [Stylophora pistillata]|uniref:protein fem-1 homolog B-like n=1 Tax=Stylophora pistillata TaxID=50429 RepID=UPI000C04C81D|nr:protein fem-1 homolog B-like [Stylophora pistillata]
MGKSSSRFDLDSDARNSCLGSVKEILEENEADIEARETLTIEGETVELCSPLFAAATGGHLDVAKLLIERNANVDAQVGTFKYHISEVRTPLMMACHGCYLDIASYLIEHGADIELQDSINRDTCLHYAARMGHVDVVDKLLSLRAEQNQNDKGVTPLFEACFHCKIEVVEYFIKRPDCSKEQRIDALELLGACIASNDVAYDAKKSLTYMKRGMEARFEDPMHPFLKEMWIGREESQTVEELVLKLIGDDEAIKMEGLFIMTRLLRFEDFSEYKNRRQRADSGGSRSSGWLWAFLDKTRKFSDLVLMSVDDFIEVL